MLLLYVTHQHTLLTALCLLGAHVVLVEPFHANAAAARLNTLRTGRVFVEQAAIWGGGGVSGGGGGGVDGNQQGVGLARLSRTNVWGGSAAEVGGAAAHTGCALYTPCIPAALIGCHGPSDHGPIFAGR